MNKRFKDDIVFARFINYMEKSLKHRAIDYFRRQNRILKKEKESSDTLLKISSDKSELSFFALIESIDLKNNIEQLSKLQQRVIIGYFFKNMKTKEIANELNITYEAVKQIKYRAILKLKVLMKENI